MYCMIGYDGVYKEIEELIDNALKRAFPNTIKDTEIFSEGDWITDKDLEHNILFGRKVQLKEYSYISRCFELNRPNRLMSIYSYERDYAIHWLARKVTADIIDKLLETRENEIVIISMPQKTLTYYDKKTGLYFDMNADLQNWDLQIHLSMLLGLIDFQPPESEV